MGMDIDLQAIGGTLFGAAVVLATLLLIGHWLLAGISRAMGRIGWLVLIGLTLAGVLSVDMWLAALETVVGTTYDVVARLARDVGIGSG